MIPMLLYVVPHPSAYWHYVDSVGILKNDKNREDMKMREESGDTYRERTSGERWVWSTHFIHV